MLSPKEIAELLETSAKTLKSLSLRNILVLCLLSIIIAVNYAIWFLLKSDNRSFLVEISGRARIVRAVDTCVIGKFYQGNNDIYAVTRNYASDSNATYYIVATLDNLPSTDKELRNYCDILEKETSILKEAKKQVPENSSPLDKAIDKTKELLNQQ